MVGLCRSEAAVFQQAVGRPALAVFGCPEPERFPEEATWAPVGVPGRSAPVARGYHCACSGSFSPVLIVSRRPVFAWGAAADLTDAAAYPSDFPIMTGGGLPQPNHEAIISLHQVRLRAIVTAH